MVACLEKTEGNSEFHEIVDFLTSSTIYHALTVSLTIYTSYNEQFWNTASSQIINDEKQIHAIVDIKAVVVTEASIRSSLLFNDADGTACLTNEAIFQNLALIGGHTSDRAGGAVNLEELLSICTNLSNRVLALETVKDAQAAEIIALKARIKKLEKKCKPSISHHRAWLKSVQRLSMKKRFGKKESELVSEGRLSEETKELKLTTNIKEIAQDKGSGKKGGSTEELVSTSRPEDSTVRPNVGTADPIAPLTTTSIFNDEDITIAQTLIKMKKEKAKEKGVSIKDIEDSSRPARSILTLKPLPIIDPKEKSKSILEEPEPVKKITRSDLDAAQIVKDAEVARLVYEEELAELERENEKRQREEEASKATIAEMYDEVQAGIEADALFKFKVCIKKVIDDFKPMDSDDAVDKEKVIEEPDSSKVEVKQEEDKESIKKRPGRRLKMKATKKPKRQKTDSDLKEKEHLKSFLQIVPDKDGEVDYEFLNKRFPIITWELKFYHLDRHGAECIYYRIFRSEGSSRWIKTFSEMVTRFNRMDLAELYNLVMQSKELASPKQTALEKTATGKETSNLFMAGSLPKTT
nr:hypothetical protein [Tanacetum cinerariifolium]